MRKTDGGIGSEVEVHVKWKFRGIMGYTRVEPWGHSLYVQQRKAKHNLIIWELSSKRFSAVVDWEFCDKVAEKVILPRSISYFHCIYLKNIYVYKIFDNEFDEILMTDRWRFFVLHTEKIFDANVRVFWRKFYKRDCACEQNPPLTWELYLSFNKSPVIKYRISIWR